MLLQRLQPVSLYYFFTYKTRVVLFLRIKLGLDNKGGGGGERKVLLQRLQSVYVLFF